MPLVFGRKTLFPDLSLDIRCSKPSAPRSACRLDHVRGTCDFRFYKRTNKSRCNSILSLVAMAGSSFASENLWRGAKQKKKPSAASFWFVLNLPRWVKTIFRTAPTFGRLPSLLSMGRLGNFQGYLTIKKRENPFLDDRHWLPLARWVDLIEFSTSDMIYRTATVF